MQTNRVVELSRSSRPAPAQALPEDEVRDARVRAVAEAVRAVYVACVREHTGSTRYGQRAMPSWDGGVDRFGRRHREIWPRIAQFILQHKVPLLPFIRAQFWATRPGQQVPRPNMLLSDQALATYARYQAAHAEDAQRTVWSECNAVMGAAMPFVKILGWDWARALSYALSDLAGLQLSPLTRYVLAWHTGLPALTAAWRDAAVMQYLWSSDAYDAIWAGFLPDDIRQEAQAIRDAFAGQT